MLDAVEVDGIHLIHSSESDSEVDETGPGRLRRMLATALARPVLATAGLGLVVAVQNLWWIDRYRLQGGFDGDETSYLASALRFRRVLEAEGFWAYLDAARSNPRNGPLTSALSALLVNWSDPIVTALAIQPIFHVVAALAVAATVRRLAGGSAALVAGVVAVALPGGILAARAFQLVPAVTAFLCIAVLALVASERGRRTGWMIGFGAAVGAMLLSRTMTVGFLPGLAVAAGRGKGRPCAHRVTASWAS